MKLINLAKIFTNISDEYLAVTPLNEFEPGFVTLKMSDGSMSPTVIKTGALIHARAVDPVYLAALKAEHRVVFVGTHAGSDGERVTINWRRELLELFDPCVVDLEVTQKAWPLLKKLSEK